MTSEFYSVLDHVACPADYVLFHPLLASVSSNEKPLFISFSHSLFHLLCVTKKLAIKTTVKYATIFATSAKDVDHTMLDIDRRTEDNQMALLEEAMDLVESFVFSGESKTPVVIIQNIAESMMYGCTLTQVLTFIKALWKLVSSVNHDINLLKTLGWRNIDRVMSQR